MLKLGSYLEASPAYRAAVARQQAKDAVLMAAERERRAIAERKAARERADSTHTRMTRALQIIKDARDGKQPPIEDIIQSVSIVRAVTVAEIESPKIRVGIVEARHEAILLIHHNYPDLSTAEVGACVGKDAACVRGAFAQAGIPVPKRKFVDRAEVLRLTLLDVPPRLIAKRLGVSLATVNTAKLQFAGGTVSPERQELLDRTVRLREKGMSYAAMAKILSVSASTIYRDFVRMGL